MSVLPGNPSVVASDAEAYSATARLIAEAAAQLRSLSLESESQSVQKVRGDATDAASSLDRVHERYAGTAQALTDYAVEMSDAHARADRADADARAASNRMRDAEFDHLAASNGLDDLRDGGADPAALAAAQRGVDDARADVDRWNDAYTDAQGEIDAALRAQREAAERARARIHDAIDSTNESFWDKVGDFFAGIGDWIGEAIDWIGDRLSDLWTQFQRILATIGALLWTALLLIAVVALAFAIGALIGWIVLAVVVFVALYILVSIDSDVNAPTPTVTRKTDVDRAEVNDPTSLASAFDEAAEVDDAAATSGDEDIETVVKLTRIVDADGTVRWRIALPSTQEWITRFGGDAGAVNDLDSNLALMLTPALQTQYERAVLEAMQQAGVGADDPVMLVGFSQGGILAGHLAAYNNDYNWQAVVVAGAPIDNMPIPDDVTVVSVQHDMDPVPRLDSVAQGGGGPINNDHWTTVQTAAPNAPSGIPSLDDIGSKIHNAHQYSLTLGQHAPAIVARHPELEQYFSQGSQTYGTETQYYRWNE